MVHPPLIGLVLAGGESQRMQQDKGLLNYYGMPQREYMYQLLQPYCEKVYICCRQEQATSVPASFSVLIDELHHIGPVAALLTAFHQYPQASFLICGCDYPLFDTAHIELLLAQRSRPTDAIVFKNPGTRIAEALLGIYENSCLPKLEAEIAAGHFSLRYFLESVRCTYVLPLTETSIHSVDTPEAYLEIKNQMGKP